MDLVALLAAPVVPFLCSPDLREDLRGVNAFLMEFIIGVIQVEKRTRIPMPPMGFVKNLIGRVDVLLEIPGDLFEILSSSEADPDRCRLGFVLNGNHVLEKPQAS